MPKQEIEKKSKLAVVQDLLAKADERKEKSTKKTPASKKKTKPAVQVGRFLDLVSAIYFSGEKPLALEKFIKKDLKNFSLYFNFLDKELVLTEEDEKRISRNVKTIQSSPYFKDYLSKWHYSKKTSDSGAVNLIRMIKFLQPSYFLNLENNYEASIKHLNDINYTISKLNEAKESKSYSYQYKIKKQIPIDLIEKLNNEDEFSVKTSLPLFTTSATLPNLYAMDLDYFWDYILLYRDIYDYSLIQEVGHLEEEVNPIYLAHKNYVVGLLSLLIAFKENITSFLSKNENDKNVSFLFYQFLKLFGISEYFEMKEFFNAIDFEDFKEDTGDFDLAQKFNFILFLSNFGNDVSVNNITHKPLLNKSIFKSIKELEAFLKENKTFTDEISFDPVKVDLKDNHVFGKEFGDIDSKDVEIFKKQNVHLKDLVQNEILKKSKTLKEIDENLEEAIKSSVLYDFWTNIFSENSSILANEVNYLQGFNFYQYFIEDKINKTILDFQFLSEINKNYFHLVDLFQQNLLLSEEMNFSELFKQVSYFAQDTNFISLFMTTCNTLQLSNNLFTISEKINKEYLKPIKSIKAIYFLEYILLNKNNILDKFTFGNATFNEIFFVLDLLEFFSKRDGSIYSNFAFDLETLELLTKQQIINKKRQWELFNILFSYEKFENLMEKKMSMLLSLNQYNIFVGHYYSKDVKGDLLRSGIEEEIFFKYLENNNAIYYYSKTGEFPSILDMVFAYFKPFLNETFEVFSAYKGLLGTDRNLLEDKNNGKNKETALNDSYFDISSFNHSKFKEEDLQIEQFENKINVVLDKLNLFFNETLPRKLADNLFKLIPNFNDAYNKTIEIKQKRYRLEREIIKKHYSYSDNTKTKSTRNISQVSNDIRKENVLMFDGINKEESKEKFLDSLLKVININSVLLKNSGEIQELDLLNPVSTDPFENPWEKIDNLHYLIKNYSDNWRSVSRISSIDKYESDCDVNYLNDLIDFKFVKRYSQKEIVISNLEKLLDVHPHFSEVIKYYISQIKIDNHKDHIKPVLLLGGNGIGKTRFATDLSKALCDGVHEINFSSMREEFYLLGLTSDYSGSKEGKIYNILTNNEGANPLCVLEDFNKADPKLLSSLQFIFEKQGMEKFEDLHFNIFLNASKMLMLALCDDLFELPKSVLSRFNVFKINKPNKELTLKIIDDIWQKLNKKGNLPALLLEVKEELVNNNLRDIESYLNDICNKANYEGLTEITPELVYNIIQEQRKISLEINNEFFTVVDPKSIDVSLDDVKGCEEAKSQVKELISLFNSKSDLALGLTKPKGLVLYGAPGVGKTMLAKTFAKEVNMPFISLSGSSFVQQYVGTGAKRVRELFNKARTYAPCIIYIDEMDGLGKRGSGDNSERDSTINEMLVQLDGSNRNDGIFVIGSTNYLENLDSALIRPGRFDRKIKIDLPNKDGRKALIEHLANKFTLNQDEFFNSNNKNGFDHLAVITFGMSGAEIQNLFNQAGIIAVRNNRDQISIADFEEAKDEIELGIKTIKENLEDRKVTAYHEIGHAVIGYLLKNTDPVVKVTVVPRDNALGVTWSVPKEDSYHLTKDKLLDSICRTLGGRAAEEIFIGEISTGASGDIKQVTHKAKSMVTKYGLAKDSRLTMIIYDDPDKLSDELKSRIENEIFDIVSTQYVRAKKILNAHQEFCHELTNLLMEKEEIYEEDIENVALKYNLFKGMIEN